MEIEITLQLSALAHRNRLALFRLLMRRYPDAVPAGEIAAALAQKANTVSSYLSTLSAVGLIRAERQGTSLLYRAQLDGLRNLFDDLLSDCCHNRPDICPPTVAQPPLLPGSDRPLNVLFICTGNSARSIMAEAILQREGDGRFRAYSAGSRPSPAPRPEVLSLLRANGHETGGLRSKDLSEFSGDDAPPMDFIFTVCDHAANEDCPAWPGQPMSAHWGLPDPVKAKGREAERRLAYQQTYDALRTRIRSFAALPYETLDRISLQHRLDDIGRHTPSE
ncbi:arsenate reductase/protein-tyrosine-phosphatase family protein [Phaeobacter inhibens]|uniref:arsenate reductase/protein-tyrosine-phosphatase family protein n=1 Tax=Phaeobacter inhibens TaxID=221822 RepID=UPI0021A855A6|nr:helix-turn-helix domain-containing protein [Phaeobacter inhibens]UWR62185.1 helix-turn-helix domain-containing protein [Phaeobacter inhibens]